MGNKEEDIKVLRQRGRSILGSSCKSMRRASREEDQWKTKKLEMK